MSMASVLVVLGAVWLGLLGAAVWLAARRPRSRASRWVRERPEHGA